MRQPACRAEILGRAAAVLTALTCWAKAAPAAEWAAPPDYAFAPLAECPLPVKLYKHCDDQMQVFLDGASKARREGRLLLVIFGADWCPECHSLDRILPTGEVLSHASFAGKFELVHIAVSVLVERKLTDVWSGLHVLRAIAAKAGPRDKIKGIPYAAVIDPASDARSAVFTLKGLVQEDGEKSRFDPVKLRAALAGAVERLEARPDPAPGEMPRAGP